MSGGFEMIVVEAGKGCGQLGDFSLPHRMGRADKTRV